jgi:hypothetical protein
MEGWPLKGGWLLLNNDSPRQSPNTNSCNNHYVVQWSNPVVEMSVGEPLISMWLLNVVKCSACLVLKECPCLSCFKPSTLISPTVLHPTVPSLFPYMPTHKKSRHTKTLCSQYYEETKGKCRNVCQSGHLGSAACGQWAAKSHWMLQ